MATDSTTGKGADGPVSSFAFPRYEQTFPELTPHEIARMRRFGEPRSYHSGDMLFETGKVGPGMFVILPAMWRSPSATALATSRR